jgi:potassium channel subfamily K, other eukaryote
MNDPGLDDAIADGANDIDKNQKPKPGGDGDLNETEEETYLRWAAENRELDTFLQPTRWWFASTEIPLIAVCFLPWRELLFSL